MASYAAINIRIKVKKDIPAAVQTFIDTIFVEANAKKAITELVDRDMNDDVRKTINFGLVSALYISNNEQLGNIDSMILQKSHHHRTFCWRVKEDHDDYTLYETRASTTHRSTNEEILTLLVHILTPYLVKDKEDIVARIIYEDACREAIMIIAGNPVTVTWTEGYLYNTESGVLNDSSHPNTAGRIYDKILSDDPAALPNTRLLKEDEEFTPSWSKAILDQQNMANTQSKAIANVAAWWS